MTEIEARPGPLSEPIGELLGRPVYQYLIGARLNWAPANPGGGGGVASLRDVWAIDVGRLRISSGGGGGLLSNFETVGENASSGASLALVDASNLRVSLGLRLYSGRAQVNDGDMAGIPGLKRTVLTRVAASFSFPGEWGGQVALSSDLLGHGLGNDLSFSIGRHWPLDQSTKMNVGFGLSFGDGENMQALFGVPEGSEAATRLGVYQPAAGVKSLSVGFGLVKVLDQHWVTFGSISFTALLKRASASPFVTRTVNNALSVGVAYRCC
ncbi:MAG: MipA/OmpV family protein [Burkholderiaceae bacterium]